MLRHPSDRCPGGLFWPDKLDRVVASPPRRLPHRHCRRHLPGDPGNPETREPGQDPACQPGVRGSAEAPFGPMADGELIVDHRL